MRRRLFWTAILIKTAWISDLRLALLLPEPPRTITPLDVIVLTDTNLVSLGS